MARQRTTQTTDDQTTDTTSTAGTDAANAEAPAPPPAARRGRRLRTDTSSNAEAAIGAGAANTPAAPPRTEEVGATADIEQPQQRQKRRQRRRSTIDTAAEASVLIAAVLSSRGPAGASQDELQQVVAWARSTRAEGQALEQVQKPRPGGTRRRQGEDEVALRSLRYELNRLLLERALAGTVRLDIRGGQLVFEQIGNS